MFVIGRKPFKSASLQSNGFMSSLFLMRFNFIFALPYSICVSLIGLAIIIAPILLIFVFLQQSYDFLLRRQCFLDKYLCDVM